MKLSFNAATVEPNSAFEPLPTSWYTGMITAAEEKDNNEKTGKYLEVTIEIMGGDYNKRKVFDRMNLVNQNPMAVDIAWRTLSAICHAVGVIQMEDTADLQGKPFLVKVSERKARQDPATGKTYEASNEVKGYKAIVAGAAPVLGPSKSAVGGAPAGVPGGATPAWANGGAAPAIAAAPAGWGGAVPAAPSAPAAATFPPEGWTAHPSAPGYFYKGQEVVTEEALRASMPPPAPVAPPVPPAAPAAPAAPVVQNPQVNQAVNNPTPPAWANPAAQQSFQPAAPTGAPAATAPVAPLAPATQTASPSAPGGAPPWAAGGQPGAAPAAATPPWQTPA